MGIEDFKSNFRELIHRVFDDRTFIVGKGRSEESREAHVDSKWPESEDDQRREVYERVLEIMRPPCVRAPMYGTLERMVHFRDFKEHFHLVYLRMVEKERIRAGNMEPIKDRNDANDLLVTVKGNPAKEDAELGCLMFNFQQENPALLKTMVDLTIAETISGTPRINSFKVAGPSSNPHRRDVLILYLNRQGMMDKKHLAEKYYEKHMPKPEPVTRKAISAEFRKSYTAGVVDYPTLEKYRTPSRPEVAHESGDLMIGQTAFGIPGVPQGQTFWGAQELYPGVGFSRIPCRPRIHDDWKLGFSEVFTDFANLMAVYLAKGLLHSAASTLDQFADCVKVEMQKDGIDPAHPNLLSRSTRQGDDILGMHPGAFEM